MVRFCQIKEREICMPIWMSFTGYNTEHSNLLKIPDVQDQSVVQRYASWPTMFRATKK